MGYKIMKSETNIHAVLTKANMVETHTKEIKLIRPPADIRAIIDKTAQFVSKNGIAFEQKILIQQSKNAKFNFLKTQDPYHNYYIDQLKNNSSVIEDHLPLLAKESKVSAIESPINETEKLQETDLSNEYSKRTFEDLYKVKIPPDLTEVEVDTMKLTAQFTARNGKAFLTGLFNREQNNPLFSFVRPNSNHFITFTNFVDAYQRIITSPKKIKEKISQELDDPNIVLTRCIKRFELDKTHNAELKFSEEAAEKERLEILSIDWYDFTIVETIEFYEEEDAELPMPTSLKDVILLSKTRESKKFGVNEAITPSTPYNERPLIEN